MSNVAVRRSIALSAILVVGLLGAMTTHAGSGLVGRECKTANCGNTTVGCTGTGSCSYCTGGASLQTCVSAEVTSDCEITGNQNCGLKGSGYCSGGLLCSGNIVSDDACKVSKC